MSPLLHTSTTFPASTPLPKPMAYAFRHSVSMAHSSRTHSSILPNRNTMMDWASLTEVKDVKDGLPEDDTPTGAMRRLEGRGKGSATPLPKTTLYNHQRRESDSKYPMTPISDSATASDRLESTTLSLDRKQVDQLLVLLASLPVRPSACILLGSDAPLRSLEPQAIAMTELLENVERRSEERERRLRTLITEVWCSFDSMFLNLSL